MAYTYAVRGWMELSWPDPEYEGVDESAEQHADKVRRVRDLLTVSISSEELQAEDAPLREKLKAGWGFPQNDLQGTEYIFFGSDVVENRGDMMDLIKEILAIDKFADGYFTLEGEDGKEYRQWLIISGKVYARRELFPDFDQTEAPAGYALVFDSAAS
ncbi:MAG: hypothetical protein GX557_04420 [Chloroflexi bacterium]|nr:hypothetical protein [Chloroflexota bacterium]